MNNDARLPVAPFEDSSPEGRGFKSWPRNQSRGRPHRHLARGAVVLLNARLVNHVVALEGARRPVAGRPHQDRLRHPLPACHATDRIEIDHSL